MKEDFKAINWDEVGKRIKAIRENICKCTQEEFFYKIRNTNQYAIRGGQGQVSKWEKASVQPRADALAVIAFLGGKSIDWLLYGSDENEKMAQFLNTNAETLQGFCVALWKFRDSLKMKDSISTAADGTQTFNISIPLIPNTRVRKAFAEYVGKYQPLTNLMKDSPALEGIINDVLHNIPDLYPRSLSPETETYINTEGMTPEYLDIIDAIFDSLDCSRAHYLEDLAQHKKGCPDYCPDQSNSQTRYELAQIRLDHYKFVKRLNAAIAAKNLENFFQWATAEYPAVLFK